MSELSLAHQDYPVDDLEQLLSILPKPIQAIIAEHPQRQQLVEVVMDLGRLPEARFPGTAVYLGHEPIAKEDLQYAIDRVGLFSSDNRAGIERTLHRISAIRNRTNEIIGLTCRVGRAVFGTINLIQDLVETGESLLLLGRPGVGKTTALREIARVLADDLHKRVVIIDTSNEIAGDGDIPHPAIGRARRMQVARPELQHQVMIEAVENHMPEVIVIDEIGTELEALAARTIAERGVQLVGTAHGNRLENLIKNPTLSDLVGGIQAVTLGDEEARRRGSQKTVLERKAPPTFSMAVEMLERQKWTIHSDVALTIDNLLRGRPPVEQLRYMNEQGELQIETVEAQPQERTPQPPPYFSLGLVDDRQLRPRPTGLRSTGRMKPQAPLHANADQVRDFERLLEQSWQQWEGDDEPKIRVPGPNGEDLPVAVTKDVHQADAVLALRSHVKGNQKLRQMAKGIQVPIYGVKSNTIPQISRALKRILGMDEPHKAEAADLRLFTRSGSNDELEALEEARLAVEQIVIPTGQPVELLPRSPHVRKMQHELVEHYRLQSDSFGDEPNRRLRIYPA